MSSNAPIIIGLGGSNHDGSAALLRGTSVEVAIEQERLTRRKHGYSWWWDNPVGAAIDYCLDAAGVSMDEVIRFVSNDLLPRRTIEEYQNIPFRLFPHHLCHAASACVMLPPGTRTAILVYDGMGSVREKGLSPSKAMRETFGFFQLDKSGLRCLGETLGEGLIEHADFPSGCSNSIGKIYEMVTAILGFDEDDTGKTMGLAAHGEPRYVGVKIEFQRPADEISFQEALSCWTSLLPKACPMTRLLDMTLLNELLRRGLVYDENSSTYKSRQAVHSYLISSLSSQA